MRILYRTANHLIWICKVVFVVTISAPEGRDSSDCVTTATRTTRALLVVRAGWRHVSKRDAGKGPYVDSDFHRSGTRQYIDGGALAPNIILAKVDVLEEQFMLFRFREYFLSLCRIELR